MIETLVGILTTVILIALAVLLIQVLLHIPKLYRFEAYKNAEKASEKYLESRLLIGIRGNDISKIAAQLDEYLNDVLGVDLDDDELICLVESRLYRTISESKNIGSIVESMKSIANALQTTHEHTITQDPVKKDTGTKKGKDIKIHGSNNDDFVTVGYDEIIGGDDC